MVRPLLIELALFLTPFVLYALFLWATKAQILDIESWPIQYVACLSIAALVLVIGSFLLLPQFGGEPPGQVYVPAHIEDGRLVPEHYIPAPK